MAEFETPPNFSGVRYDVPPMNIGQGYAAGISQAGQGLAQGISSAFDVMNRNRQVDDTLQAMQQSKILPDDAYKAVAGKSLGAKESMLGMYAGQWIAQQANQRAMALQQGQGQVTMNVEHTKLLDTINAIQGKYGPGGQLATGVNPQKMIVNPQQAGQPNQVRQAQPVQRALPVTPQPAAPAPQNVTGSPTPVGVQGGMQAAPATPQLKTVGAPLALKEPIPPGATMRQIKGPKGDIIDGVLMPDGTFRPRPIQ